MDLVYARCAGLDVHKETGVGCVRVPGPEPGERQAETKTFATKLQGLRALAAWLTAHGVTLVAMESTGVYWRPVYAVLEGTVPVRLVNARHVKMLPGRKTDVRDSEWLAQLLECGLLRGSFIPPVAVRDLRDLTRLRKTLDSRAGPPRQSHREDAGAGQHQARHGGHGHHGQDGPRDSPGPEPGHR